MVPLLRNRAGELQFPGGNSEPRETETDTAVREVKEETGLNVKNLEFLATDGVPNPQGTGRPVYLFAGITDSFDSLLDVSDDGEPIEIVHVREIARLKDFKKGHRQLLVKAGVIAA